MRSTWLIDWPDLIGRVVTLVTVIVAAFTAQRKTHRKLDQVHTIVNSRLDASLTKITDLETELRALRGG